MESSENVSPGIDITLAFSAFPSSPIPKVSLPWHGREGAEKGESVESLWRTGDLTGRNEKPYAPGPLLSISLHHIELPKQ